MNRFLSLLQQFPQTLSCAIAVLLILLLVLLMQARFSERQSRAELAIAQLQLAEQATLKVHNHIAYQIHDSVGHTLMAQGIQLENALQFLRSDPEKAETFLLDADQLGTQALQAMRQSEKLLRVRTLFD